MSRRISTLVRSRCSYRSDVTQFRVRTQIQASVFRSFVPIFVYKNRCEYYISSSVSGIRVHVDVGFQTGSQLFILFFIQYLPLACKMNLDQKNISSIRFDEAVEV